MTHVTLSGMTYRGGDNLHVHFDAGMGGGAGEEGVKSKWNVSPDFVKKFIALLRSALKFLLISHCLEFCEYAAFSVTNNKLSIATILS
jgi:hypothetical protein